MSPSADGPSLGDRLSARRADAHPSSTPPGAGSDRSPETQESPSAALAQASTTRALGAATGLLATFIAAIAFAFVLSRLVGGMYITFALPIFVGTLIAALASIGPRRFGFGDRRPLVMMMIGGALVCWLGQHMLAYLRVIDLVAAQSIVMPAEALSVAGSNPVAPSEPSAPSERALRSLEQATGESGFFAYLSFVSDGDGASFSPIGVLGRTGPGPFGTGLIAVGELGLMAAAASWSILYRTRTTRRPIAGPIAYLDNATAVAASGALEARRFDELAAIIASSQGPATHALSINEGEATAEAAILERDASGQYTQRTSSGLMPIEAAARLRRAISPGFATLPKAIASAPRAATDKRGGSDGARDA